MDLGASTRVTPRRASGHRTIVGLEWAEPLARRPACIPESRPKGVKALGLRYERKAAAEINRALRGSLVRGQWFEFVDANGHGYCQCDGLYYDPQSDSYVVFEFKLTEVDEARSQLKNLYLPVVAWAWPQFAPPRGIVVARHLTRETNVNLVYDSLWWVMAEPPALGIPTLHWIGRSAL